MPTEEDKHLLARISQLAGQINRHKNQTPGVPSAPNAQHRFNPYGSRPASPYTRGGGYRRPAQHRHRSLVLNGASAPNSPATSSDDASASGQQSTWISKTDRHLQLINSSVYEKDSQARAKAIAETQQQKRQERDVKEKAKLKSFLVSGAAGPVTARPVSDSGAYELDVEGIRFRVAKDGSKLVKLPGDINPPSATPKIAVVGGVKFFRSKTGNLYRDGIVKAHRQSGKVKKVDTPCKMFSTTGSCPKGPGCRYRHDPTKVAVCKDLLHKGTCPHGENCDLSHELTTERTPACVHYARGNCSNPKCPYTHSDVSPGAPVCRQFGLYGYCEKGSQCPERHVFECPDFSNTGKCKTLNCKLVHRERASVLRKAGQRDGDNDHVEDLSSNDDSVASDDVDSDEVEELFGDDNADETAFQEQRDYISF